MEDNVIKFPVMSHPDQPPDFITRVDISNMSDEQLDTMLKGIRERRLLNYLVYKTTEDQKNEAKTDKAKAAIEHKCDQIIRQLISVDKGFDKLEKYINELRGLRIQAGMTVI
jgi:septal ring factor EnvC (AmiA/AmiB activator)